MTGDCCALTDVTVFCRGDSLTGAANRSRPILTSDPHCLERVGGREGGREGGRSEGRGKGWEGRGGVPELRH